MHPLHQAWNAHHESSVMFNSVIRKLLNHYPLLTPRARLLKMLPDTPANFGPFGINDDLTIEAYPAGSSDHVVKSLFWLGSFDPWVCSTLKALVVPGTTALDIGANIGLMSLMMAKAGGSDCQLHAFEPVPGTCGRLRDNVAANSFANVHVHQIALSDRRGECRLVVPGDQDGMARIGEHRPGDVCFNVDMISFDEWAAERNIGKISVCKIDVEGHEPQVLAGMEKTLAAGNIDAVVFEDHASPTESLTQQTLTAHHFQILRMYKTARSVHYVRPGDPEVGSKTADYVAVRPNSPAVELLERVNQ